MKLISVLCPHCQKSVSISPQSLSNTVQCEHCNKPVLDGKPIEADVGNFDMLIKGPKPVVVTFWGANCSPCNSFKPIFEKVASEKKKQLRFLRVNVQRNKALASRYRIRGVPTLMVFKKGKQQSVLNTALRKKEFVDWLNDTLNS
ncbi:thioredoxin TrxC [Photobacterium alginatilyticum]|uniref:Thioredoxin TrxC n=1 Tax=Photobacterium alginatilyticum TaxID=1775171 RepID=A0ABW9YEV3_9GAMM|nr:thioredoxin TrxC [Photobacterium alginatilyticum]NBI52168.1 thioredoxin TrxC [Photobacterium alginatilyticum]